MSNREIWQVSPHSKRRVRVASISLTSDAICDVLSSDDHARLIASAPTLLEALQDIVADDEFCGDSWGERRDAWIATARAAIAKALGESQ